MGQYLDWATGDDDEDDKERGHDMANVKDPQVAEGYSVYDRRRRRTNRPSGHHQTRDAGRRQDNIPTNSIRSRRRRGSPEDGLLDEALKLMDMT